MRTLSAFILDRRYSVPTLRLSVMAEAGAEEAVARAILAESPWYAAVEMRDEDQLVAAVRRGAAETLADDDPGLGQATPSGAGQ